MLVAGLVTTLLLAVAGCDRSVEVAPPRPSAAGGPADPAQARQLVADLAAGVRARDAEALAALGTAQGAALLEEVAANAGALDVDRVRMRYLAEDTRLGDAEREQYGADAWAGRVSLDFGYAGIDEQAASVESRVVFAPTDDGLRIAGLGGGTGTRTPLWLQAPLRVERTARTLVSVAGDLGRYPGLVRTAVRQVDAVLPGWAGPLVVEVAGDQDQLDAALAAPEGRYDAIAGLATTVGAGARRGAPVRVMVNPGVFSGLSERGAQVVMTHEATHVATRAPFADMPVWLLEGFADYVALADGSVPVETAARQVLQRIRDQGLPDGLPTAADLEPTAADLAATYEEAWLACRFLAAEHGQARLVRLYRAVDGGEQVDAAMRRVLGVSQREFVAAWRADLADLAGVAG